MFRILRKWHSIVAGRRMYLRFVYRIDQFPRSAPASLPTLARDKKADRDPVSSVRCRNAASRRFRSAIQSRAPRPYSLSAGILHYPVRLESRRRHRSGSLDQCLAGAKLIPIRNSTESVAVYDPQERIQIPPAARLETSRVGSDGRRKNRRSARPAAMGERTLGCPASPAPRARRTTRGPDTHSRGLFLRGGCYHHQRSGWDAEESCRTCAREAGRYIG